MKKRYITIILAIGTVLLLLSACGPSATETPVPTEMSIEMAYTAAAQTVIAKLTQDAPVPTDTLVVPPTIEVLGTETPTPTVTPTLPIVQPVITPATCANSAFVSDITIPDGTLLSINSEFTKTWRVKNTGTCAWTTSFKLVFSYGEVMSGTNTALTAAVEPGKEVDLSVKLKVPNKAGQLTGVWILTDDKGIAFGTALTVVIKTSTLTATPTYTPTPTSTRTVLAGTATPTATKTLVGNTATPTATATTFVPTATPTATATTFVPTDTATPTATPVTPGP